MTFTKDELSCMENKDLFKLMSLAHDIMAERRDEEIGNLIQDFLETWQELEKKGVTVVLNGKALSWAGVYFNY